MRFKSGVEQAICILAMLALQANEKPLRSSLISERLGVSDSYLKKIMRQLVVHGLVSSDSGREGGFRLAKPLSQITLLDVVEGIETDEHFANVTRLPARIFTDPDRGLPRQANIVDAFNVAESVYRAQLQQFNLHQLLMIDRQVDWETIMMNGRKS